MPDPSRFVIIGNGAAGTTAAEHIKKLDPNADVIVIGDEPYQLYNRVALPPLLKGKVQERNVIMRKSDDHLARGFQLLLETTVDSIDTEGQTVSTSGGQTFPYDGLLVATGGRTRKLAIPGADLAGVFVFQTLDETKGLVERILESKRAVALGGSYIGYELADGFAERGLETTWIMRGPRFLWRLLDEVGGQIVDLLASDMGVRVIHDDFAEALCSDNGQVKGVTTLGGTYVSTDMVGYGVGNDLNTGILAGTGVEVNTGVVTDRFLRTNISNVFAAGDVAEFYDIVINRHNVMGTWDNSVSQGRVVARNMLGAEDTYDEVPTYVTTMFGSRLSVLGITPEVMGGLESLVHFDIPTRHYKKLFFYENRLVGAVIIGELRGRRKLVQLIRGREPVDGDREALFQLGGATE
ncbi:MAG TPA: FAD-dependent oxidoreductase [Chloroflexota bacterium]|nr:FAD-dependent oxidoreductase [Chloroflexota bacterium]